mmetsp:Transcript_12380/g.28520  ORF Transcript_12380/g.28520 Transcript_12380/m.28520 type:complete len:248 (-) Transcript_12380:22-765(-)
MPSARHRQVAIRTQGPSKKEEQDFQGREQLLDPICQSDSQHLPRTDRHQASSVVGEHDRPYRLLEGAVCHIPALLEHEGSSDAVCAAFSRPQCPQPVQPHCCHAYSGAAQFQLQHLPWQLARQLLVQVRVRVFVRLCCVCHEWSEYERCFFRYSCCISGRSCTRIFRFPCSCSCGSFPPKYGSFLPADFSFQQALLWHCPCFDTESAFRHRFAVAFWTCFSKTIIINWFPFTESIVDKCCKLSEVCT